MMRSPVLVTPPLNPLITLAEAKAHCKVEDSAEDDLIAIYIAAATSRIEGYAGVLCRALIEQDWRQSYCEFDDPLRLPLGDVIDVVSVDYYDAENAIQTLDPATYELYSDEQGPCVGLASGQSWPATYDRPDAVTITWTAGYGPDASDVPSAIRAAVLLYVGHLYDNREAVVLNSAAQALPMSVDYLLTPFRRIVV